jgi:hypothetical protein
LCSFLSASPFTAPKLLEERGGYLLHYLRLLFGEVLTPGTGLALPVEFALSLLLLGDVLPGVLLHRAFEFNFLNRYLELSVEAFHGPQSVCSEVLVLDQRLASRMSVVGSLGLAYVVQVPLGHLLSPLRGVLRSLVA